jgi:beta-fructofuranosidase
MKIGRAKNGPSECRGVIAHARSLDFIQWYILTPLTEPGVFGHMEVLKLAAINDRYCLIFRCGSAHLPTQHWDRFGDIYGPYYLFLESLSPHFDY